jgi:hypothetical protein
MENIFVNPRKTKKERCIEFLKMLPAPLFPREVEVTKIREAVPCDRATVYRARDELKLRHILLLQEAGVEVPKMKNVKSVTLRAVNQELLSHMRFMMGIMVGLEEKLSEYTKVYYDTYESDRLGVIKKYCGLDIKEDNR